MPHGLPEDQPISSSIHPTSAARLAEFREQRFGLFVHWGLYALAARHEWVKQRERLTDEQYQPYFDHFDPDLFDPDAWAEAAAGAGMRYMVLTTKHHDGFCLWDSAQTDYSVANTPHGKDLVGPIVEAFRGRGLGVGFYHSLIDWHHPHFPIDGLHPAYIEDKIHDGRNIEIYQSYLHNQVEELLTRYGRIDTMWFDFSYSKRVRDGRLTPGGKGAADWRSEELAALVRRLQPEILINDRLEIPGDFTTPEQYQPVTPPGRVWEACQTLNGSWGYDRDNLDYKSVDLLLRMLVDTVSKDGNLLLNVGPNGRGAFDPRALETLRGLGEWMRLHGRSIYGTGPSTYEAPPDCRYTQRGDRLYVHLFAWPYRHLHLPGLAGKVRYAQLLNDASEIRTLIPDPAVDSGHSRLGALPPGTLTLQLPVQRPDVAVPVIELFL
ncbi:alpha-L-fucosidase [Nonomuraea sp. NPDC005650]|uniref:alpha-L-fucosidase n=1 Tax=Nonomuraea sp. NPDC005650 TaxID=3157045 RepID=UPI0033A15E62